MKDIIKKSLLIGLGIAAVTRPKIEKLVKDFTKKKAISAKQGKDVVSDVMKQIINQSTLEKKGKKELIYWKKKAKNLEKELTTTKKKRKKR